MEGIDGSSAASRFARTAVILRALGEQIRSPKQLRNLCLANKLFHFEFVVYLYRELDTPIENLDIANPHLVHTRMLVARPTPATQDVAQHNAFNEIVQRLLERMPLLETFVWPDTVALMPSTLALLHQACRRLKGLHIHQAEPIPKQPRRLDLSGFRNLQHLTLNTRTRELLAWTSQILYLLFASPGLKSLNFSVPKAILSRALKSRDLAISFLFDCLCNVYAAAGGKPLRLRSLRCGHGVHPKSLSSLAKLTDLNCLEEVGFMNGTVLWSRRLPAGFWPTTGYRTHINYACFMPQHCPNLRRFSVSHYENGVHDYLHAVAQNPAFSKRLAVYVGDLQGVGHGDPLSLLLRHDGRAQGLPIQWRMMGLDLDRNSINKIAQSRSTSFCAKEVLDKLVSSNADSLEGLMVNLAERPDMMGFGVELCELHALKSAVRQLPRLTQLSINMVSQTSWKNRKLVNPESVFTTAHALAVAGSALTYINIFHWFWRVNRDGDGTLELEELEKREWQYVELFYQVSGKYYSRNRDEPKDLTFWPYLYQNLT